MKSAAELEKNLMSINRRSYPAYKDLRGSYQFQGYQLNIDHVQGDPFASPSKLSIQVKKIQARFPQKNCASGLSDKTIRKSCFQIYFPGKGFREKWIDWDKPLWTGGSGQDCI